jgi:hypothetical protein
MNSAHATFHRSLARKTATLKQRLRVLPIRFVLLFACIGMQACDNTKEHSKIKQNPQKFIEIHGVKPPNLGLRFDVEYTATEPDCESRTFGMWLEGASRGMSQRTLTYFLAAGSEDYDIKIPSDGLEQGGCKWASTSIETAAWDPTTDKKGSGHGPSQAIHTAGMTAYRIDLNCRRRQSLVKNSASYIYCSSPYSNFYIARSGSSLEFNFRND